MISGAMRFFDFIKIGHTIFALPFCLIAAILSMSRTAFSWPRLAWIVAAFAGARAFAMAVNRILDRRFDAQNPRTANRHLPTGTISLNTAWGFAAGCAAVFIFSAYQLGSLCFYLSPAVLLYLAFYSFTKRFTRWSHVVLGGALGLAPIGAEIAVSGGISGSTVALAAAVLFWVAGFDIFYACMDVEFDRKAGLYSLPAKIGETAARRTALLFHAAAFVLFLTFGKLAGLGRIYFSAQSLVLALLIAEHILVRKNKIEPAFFNMNGAIALVQLAAVAADIYF